MKSGKYKLYAQVLTGYTKNLIVAIVAEGTFGPCPLYKRLLNYCQSFSSLNHLLQMLKHKPTNSKIELFE